MRTAITPDQHLDRIQSLDVIRGFAVMGILLLNIVAFAMPPAAYVNPRAFGGADGADLATFLVNFLFFEGKMRALFSILFGASLLLVVDRAQRRGASGARTHYRRMFWLLLFGLAHFFLLWDGDILTLYALLGMVAYFARNLPVGRLLLLAGMLILLNLLITLPFPLIIHSLQGSGDNAADLAAFHLMFGTPPAEEIAREIATHQGSWASLVQKRLANFAGPIAGITLWGPETLGYMFLGMAGLRSGLLTGQWTRRDYVRWLAISWVIALPAYLALAAWQMGSGFSLVSVSGSFAVTTLFRPIMAIGWACLILLAILPSNLLRDRVAATGRMAFTNYLVSSLICTTIFYGYGLGWYGALSRWQLYPVVLLICSLMLLWSPLWLRRFRYGPLEYVWRRLSR